MTENNFNGDFYNVRLGIEELKELLLEIRDLLKKPQCEHNFEYQPNSSANYKQCTACGAIKY